MVEMITEEMTPLEEMIEEMTGEVGIENTVAVVEEVEMNTIAGLISFDFSYHLFEIYFFPSIYYYYYYYYYYYFFLNIL